MASVSQEIDALIARLAPETRRQRQSALLRPLNSSLIVITVIGLLVTLIESRNALGLLIMSVSLLVSIIVAALDVRGFTSAAAYLFSIWVNLGILLLFIINLLIVSSLPSGIMFGCQLALGVMLAGALLGVRPAVFFTAANTLGVAVIVYLYSTIGDTAATDPSSSAYTIGVPMVGFLVVTVVITWLYQRALTQAEERVEAARKQIIQDELIRRDLALARELQLRLFPPPPLTSKALRIASRSQPARETSGDFYDFIELGDGLLGIVTADVTGKSVAAALMMALARVTIRSEARRHAAPTEVLRAANETICRDHTARQLITAFYGVLDTHTMVLRFANAGHPYPILRRDAHLRELEVWGVPLGGRSDSTYTEHTVQLEPGDQLFLISDGLVEERNTRREMFGYGRLAPAILATDPLNPEQALEELWQTVVRFRGASEQTDDITLLVIQAVPGIAENAVGAPSPLAHRAAQP